MIGASKAREHLSVKSADYPDRFRTLPIDLHEGNATGVVSAIDLLPEVYALECLTLLS